MKHGIGYENSTTVGTRAHGNAADAKVDNLEDTK